MGHLFYGSETQPAEIPDRVLAHVKFVATTKLRRGESFTLSWRHPDDRPGGRTSIWMQPAIPLRFVFDSVEPEQLDRAYLNELAHAANTNGGMILDWRESIDPATSTEDPALAPAASIDPKPVLHAMAA